MTSGTITGKPRKGTATVEFAVVLPLIVLLLLGAVETGRGVMVCHALQEAAQAGCRVYSVEDSTLSQARAMVDGIMEDAGITNHQIQFSPSSKSGIDIHMEPVSVTVSIPFADVAWLPADFLAGATLQGRCVMPADLSESDGGDTDGHSELDDDNDMDGNLRFSGDITDDDDDDDD